MLVKSAHPELKVPREDNPRQYIEQEPVEVPASNYYMRRFIDGELLMVDAEAAPPKGRQPPPKGQ